MAGVYVDTDLGYRHEFILVKSAVFSTKIFFCLQRKGNQVREKEFVLIDLEGQLPPVILLAGRSSAMALGLRITKSRDGQ